MAILKYCLTEEQIEEGIDAILEEVLEAMGLAISAGVTLEELALTLTDAYTNNFESLTIRFISSAMGDGPS